MYCVTFKGLSDAYAGKWKQEDIPPPDSNPGWELVNTQVQYCPNGLCFVMYATWVLNEPA